MRCEGLREVLRTELFGCPRQGWAGASLHSRGLTALMITRNSSPTELLFAQLYLIFSLFSFSLEEIDSCLVIEEYGNSALL
jgi:hypothetical protein